MLKEQTMQVVITSAILSSLNKLAAVDGLVVSLRNGGGGNSHTNTYFDVCFNDSLSDAEYNAQHAANLATGKPAYELPYLSKYIQKKVTICYTSSYSGQFSDFTEVTELTDSLGVQAQSIDYFVDKIAALKNAARPI
jgi:hypothetical protein